MECVVRNYCGFIIIIINFIKKAKKVQGSKVTLSYLITFFPSFSLCSSPSASMFLFFPVAASFLSPVRIDDHHLHLLDRPVAIISSSSPLSTSKQNSSSRWMSVAVESKSRLSSSEAIFLVSSS